MTAKLTAVLAALEEDDDAESITHELVEVHKEEVNCFKEIVHSSDDTWKQAMNLAPTQTVDLDSTRRQRTNQFNKLLRMANTAISAARTRLGLPITAESRSAPKDVGVLRLPKQEFPKFSGQL